MDVCLAWKGFHICEVHYPVHYNFVARQASILLTGLDATQDGTGTKSRFCNKNAMDAAIVYYSSSYHFEYSTPSSDGTIFAYLYPRNRDLKIPPFFLQMSGQGEGSGHPPGLNTPHSDR